MTRSTPTTLLRLAALAAVYFAAGKLGLSLAFINDSASAVWPPAGLAVAFLLLFGYRAWPAIAAGAFLVNLTTSGVVASSLAIATGNTLEALAAAWWANRFARGAAAFERAADIVRFTIGSALAATTIAASIGVSALLLTGLAAPADWPSLWLTWWMGDATGTILVAPLVLLWWPVPSRVGGATPSWHRDGNRRLEAFMLLVTIVLVSLLVFRTEGAPADRYRLQFLLMPVLLWAAFRFGARETATTAAIISAFAVEATLDGEGPFVRATPNESLLVLQAYVGVMTSMMLVVAAEVATRLAAERDLRALNDTLEKRVAARTEEVSRTSERLAEAQQVAHVGSWEWDVAANTLWWSAEMCRIYGLDSAAPSYEGFLNAVHPDDRDFVAGIVQQAAADGRPFTFEHRAVRPDGSVRVLHSEGRVVMGSDGRPLRMMGIGHDITDRKQAEAEREQLRRAHDARQQAEAANQAKDRFLATLSHELRTPLNAALGWAQMLRAFPPGDQRASRATEAIYRNLLVQSRLVSDIMDVSSIAAGGFRLQPGLVDVAAVVGAAVDMVRPHGASGGPAINVAIAPDVAGLVADAARLQQVLWNLLANAVKFGGSGATVDVRVRRVDDSLEIEVSDDGPGIDPAFLPHMFEQFRQADDSVTREHGGLGLGLAIARHIVELHGGTIRATNRERGARFTVSLPLAQVAAV